MNNTHLRKSMWNLIEFFSIHIYHPDIIHYISAHCLLLFTQKNFFDVIENKSWKIIFNWKSLEWKAIERLMGCREREEKRRKLKLFFIFRLKLAWGGNFLGDYFIFYSFGCPQINFHAYKLRCVCNQFKFAFYFIFNAIIF